MSSYRVGIIGLSGIATGAPMPAPHPVLGSGLAYSHAAAYARLPNCRLVAACDLSERARTAFKDRWGERWPEIRMYDDAESMFTAEDIDLVSVATPDHLHADLVVAAAGRGIKGILCEKPLATTLADCDRMIAAVRAHGVAMNVDHTRRWVGSWHDARALIAAGRIGEVRHVIGMMGGPRAMLFRNGTHVVDLINFFAGGRPIWVSAELEAGFDHFRDGYRGDGGHDPASEPGANAEIGYDNGVRATYIGMKGMLQGIGLTIVGAEGRIEINWAAERIVCQSPIGLVERSLQLSSVGLRNEYETTALAGAIVDLIRAIEEGEPTLSPPEAARDTVAVMLGMLTSHFAGGRRVRVPKTDDEPATAFD